MTETNKQDLAWCIVELMGHRRLAGYVSEVEIAGASMLRLDIPSDPSTTQFYSASAVYCITPTTEDIARAFSTQNRPLPVSRYELPALPAPTPYDEEPDEDEDEDEELAYGDYDYEEGS